MSNAKEEFTQKVLEKHDKKYKKSELLRNEDNISR